MGDDALTLERGQTAARLASADDRSLPLPEGVLRGEAGFWQHWWNQIDLAEASGNVPLTMDIVVADTGTFEGRHWITGFDPEIRDYVLRKRLLTGRAIVPPSAIGSPAEPLLELGVDAGFEVRVLSSDARFVIYGGTTAIVSASLGAPAASPAESPAAPGSSGERGRAAERSAEAVDLHQAVQGPAILAQLSSYFELLWQLAVPLHHVDSETRRVLSLLAHGLTDVQIADEMRISLRTVSRRIAEAMQTHGANSRFELGVKFALSRDEV